MRLSLTSFIRPLVWVALATSVIAIVLGHCAPRAFSLRYRAVPRYHGMNGRSFSFGGPVTRLLDRETGRFVPLDLPAGDTVDNIVCSPWCDDRGQFQLVGRWMNYSGKGKELRAEEFGLARYTFPEGRTIERVALDMMPVGGPCWVPGLAPRILFVSGDGQIYRYSFEEEDGLPACAGGVGEHAKPWRLTWRATPPGLGPVHIKDLAWPSDPELGGRLIASLDYQVHKDGMRIFVGSHLWWFQLNGDATAIEAAGRLTVADDDDPARALEEEERLPNLAPTPEGRMVLAYLGRPRGEGLWELRVASLAVAPGTGAPLVRRNSRRVLARHCVASAPAFSTDGRWVYGLLRHAPGIDRIMVRRFAVADAQAPATPSVPGPGGGTQPTHLGRPDLAGFATSRLVDGRARHHARR